MKKALIALAALTILAGAVAPVEAHRKRSKIRGPLGSWTYGPDIPHYHPPVEKKDLRTKYYYYFIVRNIDSTDTISYYFKGTRYYLAPGTWRKHSTTNKNVSLRLDYTAGNNSFDSVYRYFDANTYDIKIWRKGKHLRTKYVYD